MFSSTIQIPEVITHWGLYTNFIIMIISEISVKETYNDINHISMETSSKHLAACQIPPPLVCPIAMIMTQQVSLVYKCIKPKGRWF